MPYHRNAPCNGSSSASLVVFRINHRIVIVCLSLLHLIDTNGERMERLEFCSQSKPHSATRHLLVVALDLQICAADQVNVNCKNRKLLDYNVSVRLSVSLQ